MSNLTPKRKKKAAIADLPNGVGVYPTYNGHGQKRWKVRLGKKFTGGPVVNRTFTTLTELKEWLKGEGQSEKTASPSPLVVKESAGAAGFELTTRQLGEAIAAQKLLNEHNLQTTIFEAVEFYVRHAKPSGGEKSISEAIEELLAVKRRAGKKENYIKNLAWPLKRFASDFEDSKIHEVTKEDFESWLDEEDFSLPTRRNYIRDCNILFNFAISKKWMNVNPTEGLEKPTVEDKEIRILTVRQAARLLLTAQKHEEYRPWLAPVAIMLFAGVRTSEIKRLDWNDVRSKQIVITAANAKTRQRRTITITPALESWIACDRKSSGPVFPKGKCWRRGFSALVAAAKIQPWPRNALRHSFGSYHFALHKNENLTAAEMGNTPEVVFKHYRAVILDGDEIRFWNLINRRQEGKVVPFKVA